MKRNSSADLYDELPWIKLTVCQDAEVIICNELKRLNYTAVVIQGENISDEASMFAELSIALGFEKQNVNEWGEFLQFFGELMFEAKNPVVLLWRDASSTIATCLGVFLVAIHHLTNQTEAALRVRDDMAKFEIILLGRGEGFDAMPHQ